jgi:hypothetical protein
MAFTLKFLSKVSSSGNGFGPNVWAYNGSSADGSNDAVATIAASGYFNNAQVNLDSATGKLKIGDVIMVRGSDANGMYSVTAVTTAVTVSSYAAVGTIDTAQLAANAVTSAKLDVSLVQSAAVSLTLAEFIALYTTSHELVAAPGASLKLVLMRSVLGIDYGGTVLASGGAMHVQYDSTANGAGTKASGTLAAATVIAATADTTFGFSPVDTTLVDSTTLNKGLFLAMATGDFTGGTASTYEAHTLYSTMDLS